MRGALLVDWENLVYDLYEQNYYYSVEELARRLYVKATDYCKNRFDVNLTYRGVFAPAKAFIPAEADALVNAGFDVVNTLGGKNAADLEVAIKSMRLLLQQAPYTHFIVVTGDVDYLPLARAIKADDCVCYLWPVALNRVGGAVRNYEYVEYIPNLLELEQGDPPSLNEARLFMLLCHRLIDEGYHLGGIQQAKAQMVKLGVLNESQVDRAWVQHADSFAMSRLRLHDGHEVNRRRPAYEDAEVKRTYLAADVILDMSARRDRQGGAREGELLETVGEIFTDRKERIEFVRTMVEAGYLRQAGDRYTVPSRIARYGIVRPLQRLVSILWTISTERGWNVVSRRSVAEKWERHFKPGGNLKAEERELAHAHAHELIKRCERICLAEMKVDGEHRGYRVRWDHPVAMTVRSSVIAAVRIIASLDKEGNRIPEEAAIKGLMAHFANEPEARFWLGLLAADSHVRWFDGACDLRRSRLVQGILSGEVH